MPLCQKLVSSHSPASVVWWIRISQLSLMLCLGLWITSVTATERAVPVITAIAGAGDVKERLPITGTITAAHFAELSPAVAGLVSALAVDIGARVSQGDVLLTLDSEISAMLLQGAQARVRQAQAMLNDVQRQLEEARSLETESIAASQVRSLASQADMAAAALASAQADARRAQAELTRHKVKAPFAGVISARHADVGEWVAPGDAVLTLVDITQLYADFSIAQRYLKDVNNNSELTLRLDSQPNKPLQASIASIVPVSDPTARTFLLRAIVQTEPFMAPGMSVRGEVVLTSEQDQLVLPRDALIRYPDGRVTAWLVDKTGAQPVARERSLRIREGYGQYVVITDGISAGDEVVLRGNEGLRDGTPLVLQNE